MMYLELLDEKIKYWLLPSTKNVEGFTICSRELKKFNLIKTAILYGATEPEKASRQLAIVEKRLSIVMSRFLVDPEWEEEELKEYKKEFNKTYDAPTLRKQQKTLKHVIEFFEELK